MGRALPAALLSLGALVTEPVVAELPGSIAAQLRCPFAKVWLDHGPDRAAEMLGVEAHMPGAARRLAATPFASCTYSNPWAGASCMELRGTAWTEATAKAKCDAPMQGADPGTLAMGAACAPPSPLAGWCVQTANGQTWADVLKKSGSCGMTSGFCPGTFEAAGDCAAPAPSSGTTAAPASGGAPATSAGGVPLCSLAPGPIGAAHQLAQSPGYSLNCEGTPAQQSPYMWPLKWTAKIEAQSMAYTSDAVRYESRGRVWYMLDKNWKRLDTWYQSGIQRAVGQGPCDNPVNMTTNESTILACNRTGPVNSTMLHRGDRMVFIDWGADDKILNCTYLSLGVIGNIRPDWYMDARGATTSVQYLGDSHVFYMGEPRLVKQWRKKDFANQYFTMSMQKHPDPDGTRWPLILNVPGEGFGDDFLQHWSEHRHLQDSEAAAFLLDEAHIAAGGKCTQLRSSGGSGPPVGEVEHVPSNLEVEEASWREIVYTESPVWKEPAATGGPSAAGAGAANIPGGGIASACWDASLSSMRIEVRAAVPRQVWTAIGFRETDECLMTPRGGGAATVVLASSIGEQYSASVGLLRPEVKSFSPEAFKGFKANLTSAPAEGITDIVTNEEGGEFVLALVRKYDSKPDQMNLTFALGTSDGIGYHARRDCFAIAAPPECPVYACAGHAGP